MSFFIKGKRKNGIKTATQNFKKAKDEELTSESETDEVASEQSEDENETAQEKRVKLAKIYLDEIQRLENKNDDEVNAKLKEDYLIETGRYRSFVANDYTKADENYLNVIRNKVHQLSVTCLCVSADDQYIFSGSKDGSIIKWSLKERKKITSIRLSKNGIVCLAISDNNKYLAIGDSSKDILIYNPDDLTFIHTFKGHREQITGLVYRKGSPLYLYSCSKDKSVKCWSLEEFSYLETLFGHQDVITGIDALYRERAVTCGGSDNTIRIWKIAEESQLIFNGSGNIDCVKYINEDNFVSGSDNGELSIWSCLKKKPLCAVPCAHGSSNSNCNWITSVAPFVNTDLIASGSNDGFIRLWKLSNSYRSIDAIFTIPVQGFVNCLTFSNDGRYLIAGIGQEHRCGRWSTNKSAKNGIMIIPLIKNAVET